MVLVKSITQSSFPASILTINQRWTNSQSLRCLKTIYTLSHMKKIQIFQVCSNIKLEVEHLHPELVRGNLDLK
jgi:hypothetical protein